MTSNSTTLIEADGWVESHYTPPLFLIFVSLARVGPTLCKYSPRPLPSLFRPHFHSAQRKPSTTTYKTLLLFFLPNKHLIAGRAIKYGRVELPPARDTNSILGPVRGKAPQNHPPPPKPAPQQHCLQQP